MVLSHAHQHEKDKKGEKGERRTFSRWRRGSDDDVEGLEEQSSATALTEATRGRRYVPKEHSFKFKLNATLEDPAYSTLAHRISLFMMLIIVTSTIAFVLESEICTEYATESHRTCDTGVLDFEPWAWIFYVVEWISSVIFAVEYSLRLYSSGDGLAPRRRFFFDPLNLIDFVAFAPFFVTGVAQSPMFPTPTLDGDSSGGAGFLRAVRLLRVFRLFKVGRYSLGIRVFAGAIRMSLQAFVILLLTGTVTVIIFSSLIWCALATRCVHSVATKNV